MRDYQFYDYQRTEPTGFRRIVTPLRRLLRRLLLPAFQRQVELYRQLDADIDCLSQRLDRLDQQPKATIDFGSDYVAIVRRLAALEEHVEGLMQREAMAELDRGSPIAIEPPILKLEESGNGDSGLNYNPGKHGGA